MGLGVGVMTIALMMMMIMMMMMMMVMMMIIITILRMRLTTIMKVIYNVMIIILIRTRKVYGHGVFKEKEQEDGRRRNTGEAGHGMGWDGIGQERGAHDYRIFGKGGRGRARICPNQGWTITCRSWILRHTGKGDGT